MTASLAAELSPETIFREHEPLRQKVTLKTGGTARFYAEPATVDDFRVLLKRARDLGVKPFFLGRGSNLLVLEGELPYLVIRLRHENWRQLETLGENRLRAGAGVRLRELCMYASRIGLSGFEFLEGIPGTVGGGLRMNAGAMGGWMFQIVEEVHLLTLDGEEQIVPREKLTVGYRHCKELEEACALGTVLRAPGRDETSGILERIREFQKRRNETQPSQASAGCMFKNPEGDSAGRLIDQLGLKGLARGEAEVSEVHGNFLINKGGATSRDMIELIRTVRQQVQERTGIVLQPEVQLLGGEWKDFL